MAARSSLGFLDSTFSPSSDSEHLEITPWTTRLASVDLWIVFASCSLLDRHSCLCHFEGIMGGGPTPLGNVCAKRLRGNTGHRRHPGSGALVISAVRSDHHGSLQSLMGVCATLSCLQGRIIVLPWQGRAHDDRRRSNDRTGRDSVTGLVGKGKSVAPGPVEEILKMFGRIGSGRASGEEWIKSAHFWRRKSVDNCSMYVFE